MDVGLLTTCAVGGVAWGAGFAAGFKAAGKKEHEADTGGHLVFAMEVLPSDWAEGVFSDVAVAVEAGAVGYKDARLYHALGALRVAGEKAASDAFCGKGAERFLLLVCKGLKGAVCAAGLGSLTRCFKEVLSQPRAEVYEQGAGAYTEDNPCRCLVVCCDAGESELGKVLLGGKGEEAACGCEQSFVLWRDDKLKKFLEDGEPGGFHAGSVTC